MLLLHLQEICTADRAEEFDEDDEGKAKEEGEKEDKDVGKVLEPLPRQIPDR